jgi:hypothetical protein
MNTASLKVFPFPDYNVIGKFSWFGKTIDSDPKSNRSCNLAGKITTRWRERAATCFADLLRIHIQCGIYLRGLALVPAQRYFNMQVDLGGGGHQLR